MFLFYIYIYCILEPKLNPKKSKYYKKHFLAQKLQHCKIHKWSKSDYLRVGLYKMWKNILWKNKKVILDSVKVI